VILPGSTIGVLGSGQLGRMFALEARRMGYRVHTYSPDSDTPTGQIADLEVTASYEDLPAIRKFAESVDVITFEFENVPSSTVEAAAEIVKVRPAGSVLHTTQHRKREKAFLAERGYPVTRFKHIKNLSELKTAVQSMGFPCVLKTAGFGYDGKGQRIVQSANQIDSAYLSLAGDQTDLILEAFVDFDKELSVVAARSVSGEVCNWGTIENKHHRHILDVSSSPADVSAKIQQEAIQITQSLLTDLDVIGVLCVEFFLTRDGKLLINELAPRPHNSGHLTMDASMTSQFEQQLRAVCGLPLGSTRMLSASAMANLLGDLWQKGEPNWQRALATAPIKLHLYGKLEARPGRKMGHLTALDETAQGAIEAVVQTRDLLKL
jgi:5-(carboxyamino)imidazole ribonucleotide synthase